MQCSQLQLNQAGSFVFGIVVVATLLIAAPAAHAE